MDNTTESTEKKSKTSKITWIKRTLTGFSTLAQILAKLTSVLFYLVLISVFLAPSLLSSNSSASNVLTGSGENQIALIDISGVITEAGNSGNGFTSSVGINSPRALQQTFETLKNKPELKAIILRIDSPGGSVTASEEMYQIIRQYRQQLNIPIIASMGDTAASGGYYIALGADKIVANSTTITGSIGVILQTFNVSELAEKYGVRSVVVKSGPNKDLLNPLEPVKDDQIVLLDALIKEAYDQFLSRILERRPIESAKLTSIADGRILSGQQAYQEGLVDKVGTLSDTIDYTLQLTNLNSGNTQVIQVGGKSLIESILGAASSIKFFETRLPMFDYGALRGKPSYLFMQ